MKRKNIINAIFGVFALLFMFIISACSSNNSGINANNFGEWEFTVAKNKVTINLAFNKNDLISSKAAVPYINYYLVDGETTTYKDQKAVTFSNDVYTSSKVEVTSLQANTTYKFVLYVTYNGYDEEITSKEVKTLDETSKEIKTAAEFKAMTEDADGTYVLGDDIDFEGAELNLFSSNQFTGTFDGNGHTVKNFKLSDQSNAGLFAATKGAEIKNLKVEDVTASYVKSSGRSNIKVGALIGNAVDTKISDITVNNYNLEMNCSASAESSVGGVIGEADGLSATNVKATNMNINFKQLRLKISTGLFAGVLKGNSSNNDEILVNNSSAQGTIKCVLYYPSSSSAVIGSAYVGGFVGNLGSSAKILNSYSNADIYVSKSDTVIRSFVLSLGGFVGANYAGSMAIEKCAAISNINAYAGKITENDGVIQTPTAEEIETFNKSELATKTAYIGKFIGRTSGIYKYIKDSVAVTKNDFNVYAKSDNYVVTEDTEFDADKVYYKEENENYVVATVNPGDKIADADPVYVVTEDTEFESGKDYYLYDGTNYVKDDTAVAGEVIPTTIDKYELTLDEVRESGKEYYEKINDEYVLTEDAELDITKDYYEKTTTNVTYYEKQAVTFYEKVKLLYMNNSFIGLDDKEGENKIINCKTNDDPTIDYSILSSEIQTVINNLNK